MLRREVHQGSDLRDGAYAPASHGQQVEEEAHLLVGTGQVLRGRLADLFADLTDEGVEERLDMDAYEFVTEEGIGRVAEGVDLLVVDLAELYRILAQRVDGRPAHIVRDGPYQGIQCLRALDDFPRESHEDQIGIARGEAFLDERALLVAKPLPLLEAILPAVNGDLYRPLTAVDRHAEAHACAYHTLGERVQAIGKEELVMAVVYARISLEVIGRPLVRLHLVSVMCRGCICGCKGRGYM